jgi:hypothetical protein
MDVEDDEEGPVKTAVGDRAGPQHQVKRERREPPEPAA